MNIRTFWNVIRFLITASILFIIWLIFNSSFDAFSLIAGLSGSLGIAFLTFKVFIQEYDASRHTLLPHPFYLTLFLITLILNLYISSIKMIGAIIYKNPTPRIVHFRTRLHSDLARMVLANSITFTPGTITLDLNDDHLTVHWFFSNTNHSKLAGETIKGKIEEYLRKVWV